MKSARRPVLGFTLIELLVVISIIAILSVVGVTVFTGVQKNSRDARRRADIDAITNALESHYQIVNSNCAAGYNYCAPYPSLFVGGTVPKDPKGGNYIYNGSSTVDMGGLLPGDGTIGGTARSAQVYTICADLEGVGSWTGEEQNYCKSNQQ